MFEKILRLFRREPEPEIIRLSEESWRLLKRTQGNEAKLFHAYLIGWLRMTTSVSQFDNYCRQYHAAHQPLVRMAFASYILCLMTKGMKRHLTAGQVHAGLSSVQIYLQTCDWYDEPIFDRIWRITRKQMRNEMMSGQYSGTANLVAFIMTNLMLADFHEVVNTHVAPEIALAFDYHLLATRKHVIDGIAQISENALQDGII